MLIAFSLPSTPCVKKLVWTRLDSFDLVWIRLDSAGLGWTQLDSAGLGWIRLDLAGHGWTQLLKIKCLEYMHMLMMMKSFLQSSKCPTADVMYNIYFF